MRNWIIALGTSALFFLASFFVYYAISNWTQVNIDKSAAFIAIAFFSASPVAAVTGQWINRKVKG